MPHALTDRQKECLEYIWDYVAKNESSPRLEEIAAHLDIKLPTAHKLLKALTRKGYLYFGRDSLSGFFIRLIERAGSAETVIEIPIAGKVNRYGEVYDFPKKIGHFATLLLNSKPGNLFALKMAATISEENLVPHDLIICEQGISPNPGDYCIAPIGTRQFLIRLHEEVVYTDTNGECRYTYWPVAYNEENHAYFMGVLEQEGWHKETITESMIIATALRLSRPLSY